MKTLYGQRIADGVAIGFARIIQPKTFSIPADEIPFEAVGDELKRLDNILETAQKDLQNLLEPNYVTEAEKDILDTHIQIMQDPELLNYMQEAIREKYMQAAKAIFEVYTYAIGVFQNIENEMFKQRAVDYKDVRTKLLNIALHVQTDILEGLNPEEIPVFKEIEPSMISALSRKNIRAVIVESCGINSHAAIISRALGIGLISGVEDLFPDLKDGTSLIVDAEMGQVIVNPNEEMLEYYAQRLQVEKLLTQKQERIKKAESITKDGKRIRICLNLGVLEELDQISQLNTDGIGLYRTEFLYLSTDKLPDEESQFEAYRQVLETMSPKPVTIRTFDLGGDKLADHIPFMHEENPYLGNRGIRFSLSHPQLFKTQLRAILRASAFGKAQIMFPMIMDLEDFKEAKAILETCKSELYALGLPFDDSIFVGCMIETPSAALCSDKLAEVCDFFSIGTNDLAQYALAVDRNSELVSRYYITHHPAVLMLIRITVNNAKKAGIPVSVCGEIASQKEIVPLLVGMGIHSLSVNKPDFLKIKSTVLNCDAHLDELVKNFDFSGTVAQVEDFIYNQLRAYHADIGRHS